MRTFRLVGMTAFLISTGCGTAGPAPLQELASTTGAPTMSTSAAPAAAQPACQRNEDCIAQDNGAPAICRASDHTCVALLTPECPTLVDTTNAISNDATIVLGYVGCSGTGSAPCLQREQMLELVQNQFMTQTKGVTVGGVSRPVVWLDCEEAAGSSSPQDIVNHLTQEVQVPVIGGIDDDSYAWEIVPQLTRSGAFVVNADLFEEPLANLPGNPVAPEPNFWRAAGWDKPFVGVVAAAASDGGPLQQRYVARGNPDPSKTPEGWRILILKEASLRGTSWYQQFLSSLTFNGVSGLAVLEGDRQHVMVVNAGVPLDPATPGPVATGADEVAAALAFKPNFIFYASDDPTAPLYVVNPIEEAWPVTAPLPFHLALTSAWTANLATPLHDRVFIGGLDVWPTPLSAAQESRITGLYQEYDEYFGIGPGTPEDLSLTATPVSLLAYDSLYVSEVLLSGLGDKPVTATNAAAAALNLAAHGARMDDTPENIESVMTALGAGTPVTIGGMYAPLEFDPKEGAPKFDGMLECVVIGPDGPIPQDSGFHFSAAELTPTGAYSSQPDAISGLSCP